MQETWRRDALITMDVGMSSYVPGRHTHRYGGPTLTDHATSADGRAQQALSPRDGLRAAIAAQLASNHRCAWESLAAAVRADYLADADALIDQGMTPFWEDHDPGTTASPALEAEVFEFDRSMEWFMSYLNARHPHWRDTSVYPSSHIEESDPEEWDAWVTVAVSVSEAARILWSRRFATQTGEPIPAQQSPLPPVPSSAPPAARTVRRDRAAAAIGAVLAHRHQRRWMDLPNDLRAAYVSDATCLIEANLTCF